MLYFLFRAEVQMFHSCLKCCLFIVLRLYDDLTRQQQPNIDEWGRDIYRKKFAEWFEEHVCITQPKFLLYITRLSWFW